jgi:hypothetical protein
MRKRQQIILGKGQGNNPYNVRDVRGITYRDCPHKGEIMRIFHNIQ